MSDVARGALKRLSEPERAETSRALPAELRVGPVSLVQLSRLAYLQAGDPLVDQVLAMLKEGRPVFLDRSAAEASIRLSDYPPRVQEQFQRWFVRIAGYGIALTGDRKAEAAPSREAPQVRTPEPRPASPAGKLSISTLAPDRQILSEILGNATPEPHPCWLEPKKLLRLGAVQDAGVLGRPPNSHSLSR